MIVSFIRIVGDNADGTAYRGAAGSFDGLVQLVSAMRSRGIGNARLDQRPAVVCYRVLAGGQTTVAFRGDLASYCVRRSQGSL